MGIWRIIYRIFHILCLDFTAFMYYNIEKYMIFMEVRYGEEIYTK